MLSRAQGAVVERDRLGIFALGPVQPCQIDETGGDLGMLGTQRLLVEGQGAVVERGSLSVSLLGMVQRLRLVATWGCSRPTLCSLKARARW